LTTIVALAYKCATADLPWDWKYNNVETFDPALFIPRAEVKALADDSSGMIY
jgi:hypothetical protein